MVQVLLSPIDGVLCVLHLPIGFVQLGLCVVDLGLRLLSFLLRGVGVLLGLVQVCLSLIVVGLGFVQLGLRFGLGGLCDVFLRLCSGRLRLLDGFVHIRLRVGRVICERGDRRGERRCCHGCGDECLLALCQSPSPLFVFSPWAGGFIAYNMITPFKGKRFPHKEIRTGNVLA